MSRESAFLGEERRRILYARSRQKDPLGAHESTMPMYHGGTKTVPSAPIQYVVMALMATSKHTHLHPSVGSRPHVKKRLE